MLGLSMLTLQAPGDGLRFHCTPRVRLCFALTFEYRHASSSIREAATTCTFSGVLPRNLGKGASERMTLEISEPEPHPTLNLNPLLHRGISSG